MTRKASTIQFHNTAALSVQLAIDENPLSRKPLAELVPGLYVGRNQLQAEFKRLTGQTLKRYRLIKRMEAARELLAIGDANVKEVAITCGYKKQGNFTADYKDVFQKTPFEWLQESMIRRMQATVGQ